MTQIAMYDDRLYVTDYFRPQAVFQHAKLADRSIFLDVQHSNWCWIYLVRFIVAVI